MTTQYDFDRIAAAWLADGPVELSDRVLDAALDEVHTTRQRRVLRLRRFSTMPSLLKLAAAAAAMIAVLAVGSLLLPRGSGQTVGGSPSPTAAASPSPAAVPSPTATVQFLPARGIVEPGTYVTDQIRPTARFRLGDRMDIQSHDSTILVLSEVGLNRHLAFFNPTWVHDPATGAQAPLPDDLAAWFAEHPGLDTSAPTDTTVGGLPARVVEGMPRNDATFAADGSMALTGAPAVAGLYLFAGDRFRIAIVDAPERVLLVVVAARADRFDEFAPKAQAVVDSLALGD